MKKLIGYSKLAMNKHLLYIGFYSFVSLLVFVLISNWINPRGWFILVEIVVLLITCIAVILMTSAVSRHRLREYVLFLPSIILLLASIMLLWLMRFLNAFCFGMSVLLAFYIAVSNYVAYYEPITEINDSNRELIHARYLEFMRTFMWAVIFIVIAFVIWVYQGESEFPSKANGIPALIILAIVFMGGGGIVFLETQSKLREIEDVGK